jgi:hypothetical protein
MSYINQIKKRRYHPGLRGATNSSRLLPLVSGPFSMGRKLP